MRSNLSKFQIGKLGLTDGVIDSLNFVLKNHRQVRISVLKSCCRDREELKLLTQKIIEASPYNLKYRIIGFTIVLSKFKK